MNMNKKLMVGALAVAIIGGGAIGATLLPSTNAASSVGTTGATAPTVQSPVQPANDQETNDDAVTGTQAAPDHDAVTGTQAAAADKETNDDAVKGAVDQETNDGGAKDAQDAQDAQGGNDLETNDDAAAAPATK
jgi:hypothetical protein